MELYFSENTVACAVAELRKRGLGSAETHSGSSAPMAPPALAKSPDEGNTHR